MQQAVWPIRELVCAQPGRRLPAWFYRRRGL